MKVKTILRVGPHTARILLEDGTKPLVNTQEVIKKMLPEGSKVPTGTDFPEIWNTDVSPLNYDLKSEQYWFDKNSGVPAELVSSDSEKKFNTPVKRKYKNHGKLEKELEITDSGANKELSKQVFDTVENDIKKEGKISGIDEAVPGSDKSAVVKASVQKEITVVKQVEVVPETITIDIYAKIDEKEVKSDEEVKQDLSENISEHVPSSEAKGLSKKEKSEQEFFGGAAEESYANAEKARSIATRL